MIGQQATKEVFQIFVVRDNIYGGGRAFQVMSPGGECLEDRQELLVVSIIVQLRSREGAGVKSNGVDLIVRVRDGEDGGDGVVGGVSLYPNRSVGGPVNEHQCRGERIFQAEEGLPTVVGEVPRNSFSGEAGERDHDVRVALDEPAVEIGEAKEGLNVLDFPRFGPIENCLDFVTGHREPGRGKDISAVFDGL